MNYKDMKTIIVQDFITFLNMDNRPENMFIPAYRSGYWNVYQFSDDAVGYLEENCISYKISNK